MSVALFGGTSPGLERSTTARQHGNIPVARHLEQAWERPDMDEQIGTSVGRSIGLLGQKVRSPSTLEEKGGPGKLDAVKHVATRWKGGLPGSHVSCWASPLPERDT